MNHGVNDLSNRNKITGQDLLELAVKRLEDFFTWSTRKYIQGTETENPYLELYVSMSSAGDKAKEWLESEPYLNDLISVEYINVCPYNFFKIQLKVDKSKYNFWYAYIKMNRG